MNSKSYIKKVSANIKLLRKEKGLTQVELAAACNFEKQNMQRIESGKTAPTLKTLLKIADALDVDIQDIVISNRD
ncbi:MAG: helix-turn-helix transcriptional regulator [Bacteroidia bacterium]|nr:helix-turn-helix transcriptional regulator [Bacteroidia bacterium]